MSQILSFLIVIILFSSCSYDIVRKGYKPIDETAINCEIIIKKDTIISDTIAKKIGTVKLHDGGFTVKCSEDLAVKMLKKEACSINADIIVITEERRPDILSSCYRCNADFYKYKLPTRTQAS